MKRKDQEHQIKIMNAWNSRHSIGTPLSVTRDNGEILEGKSRSEAFLTEGDSGYAVIHVTGISGYYLLSRIKAHVA